MDLAAQHLKAIRLVCRSLESQQQGWDAVLNGKLTLSSTLYSALDLLINDGVFDRQVKVGHEYPDWNGFSPASTDIIELELPITEWAEGEAVVYRNLSALIGRGLFLQSVPKAFYLIQEDLIVPPDQPNEQVARYLDAVAVADLLTQQADHADQTGGTPRLIFLHKVSIPIPIRYSLADLNSPLEGLQELQTLLSSEEHKEQKRSLLKAALYNRLSTEEEAHRFACLLKNFQEVSREVRENYQLFVCEYDFDKVREELEEKKREYLSQLNAAFNDMGAKLLSIPLAFYIAVTKMEPLSAGTSTFESVVLNTLVTLAVVTVSVYILMLLHSHRNTLEAIGDEYSNLFDRWLSKLKDTEQSEQVTDTRKALDQRKGRVLWYFRITIFSVLGTLAITLGLYAVRLFRWEAVVWDGVRALTALISA